MNTKPTNISRRTFLGLSAIGLAVGGGTFVFLKRLPIQRVVEKVRYGMPPYRIDVTTGKGSLEHDEMENLLSLAYVLIPWHEGTDTVAAVTREYVEGECLYEPGALNIYRNASILLDQMARRSGGANGRFSELEQEQKEEIVSRIIPAPIRSRRDWRHVYNIIFRFEETQMTELVTSRILTNFYNDDRSWGYL